MSRIAVYLTNPQRLRINPALLAVAKPYKRQKSGTNSANARQRTVADGLHLNKKRGSPSPF
jgi:hypothetical protein